MKRLNVDVAVIGGGPAGLAAALAARGEGAAQVVILERNSELGGILQQCIHHGFGLHRFQEELTGPEYAQRFIDLVQEGEIQVLLETMVLEITKSRRIYAVSSLGMLEITAQAIVLAMGCRERTRGVLRLPGSRPAGVYTAGTAQRLVNIDGYLPGKKVVILGSGDIGLIMARRFTLEGAQVQAVVEALPYAAGLTRNVVQCLQDFGIPLYLQSTVVEIRGKNRLEAVTVAQVDRDWDPVAGTEKDIECDTLLLSVGLIPENELSKKAGVLLDPVTQGPLVDQSLMTSVPGIFACGNALHVHDLVDNVSQEGELAGRSAGRYTPQKEPETTLPIRIKAGNNIRYILPQVISGQKPVQLFLRVAEPAENVILDVGGLRRIKKRVVRPSEMLDCTLTPQILEKAARELTVQVISPEEAGFNA